MSAIAGILNFNKQSISEDHINGIMNGFKKFPSDVVQVWKKENVFLGCHAQWITPESIGEELPFYDYEKQLAITADAIIDNREELFQKLHIANDLKETISDSKLILLAYKKWGHDVPKHLIGDFAFVIWDEKKQKLFGARDPSGYRTLYYTRNLNAFAFCSTIEPLLSLPFTKRKLNEQWLAEFLAIIGTTDTVDATMTPYEGIEELPPFHSFSIEGEQIEVSRYGVFPTGNQTKYKSNEEYIEAFQDIFQKAVDCRLRTYKNVGSQLSGGLDSGSVVGFAAKSLKKEKKTLQTFSYIPPKDFVDYTPKHLIPNETPYIKKTIKHVGNIQDHYFDFNDRNSYSEINHYLNIMEMPYKFVENSFWLRGMFEKAQEQDIGILLNGDRGNFTISWGSALNYYATLLKKLKFLHLYKELNQFGNKVGGARLRRIPHIVQIGFPFIAKSNLQENPPSIINPEFANRTKVYEKLNECGFGDHGWFSTSNIYKQRKILYEDIIPWNSGNTLNSKLSLQHSLWKRDPTNDIRVIRFCLSLPESQYVQNGLDRALIRRSTNGILPDEVRLNQHVRGVQAADWIHRMVPSWTSFVKESMDLIKDSKILEFINKDVINSAIKKAEEVPVQKNSNFDFSLLMRCVILHRFLTKFH